MKKILFLSAILCAICVSALNSPAQPSSPTGSAAPGTNLTTLDQVFKIVGTPTNYAVETYFTFAPKAPQHYGGGILGVYNVNEYVGMGIGLDWLGDFSLVSGNVQLQLPFHPLPNQFPTLVVSPFVLGGIATAYTGAGSFNGGASTVEDVGGYIKFGHLLGGQFNTGICWGQWTGVGPYNVKRYHAFVGWSHGF